MKRNILYLIIVLILSCSSTKEYQNFNVSNKGVNSEINEEYWSSIKSFIGELSNDQYPVVIKKIEKSLKVKINRNKPIVIHFRQRARNCLEIKKQGKFLGNEYKVRNTTILDKFYKDNNAEQYFVFTKDFYGLNQVNPLPNWILIDDGFFYKKIFTLHDYCTGFFVLKPNGKFFKHYGPDYYTQLINFLKLE